MDIYKYLLKILLASDFLLNFQQEDQDYKNILHLITNIGYSYSKACRSEYQQSNSVKEVPEEGLEPGSVKTQEL